MNSFDVFDTLIARRFSTSQSIWEQMARESGIHNFSIERQRQADAGWTLQIIYDALVAANVIPEKSKNELMEREVELEIENCIPIKENIEKINHGDILISDTHLSADVILRMLRFAGLDKQVTIHQSNRDKATGFIWDKLKNIKPNLHTGDNIHSDLNMPLQFGINAELFSKSEFSPKESYLVNFGLPSLAFLCREIRLKNNVPDELKEYFNLSNSSNLPLLFTIIELIRRTFGEIKIAFLGRDCQLLWKMYSQFYSAHCSYVPFSRIVAYDNPNGAISYLKRHCGNHSLIVDISSTGKTWKHLSSHHDYSFNVLSIIFSDIDNKIALPPNFHFITKNSVCGQTNITLELMNCADHGYLSEIKAMDDIMEFSTFADNELPDYLIDVIHQPVHDAIKLKNYYGQKIKSDFLLLDNEKLSYLFNLLTQDICSNYHLCQNISGYIGAGSIYDNLILEKRKNHDS